MSAGGGAQPPWAMMESQVIPAPQRAGDGSRHCANPRIYNSERRIAPPPLSIQRSGTRPFVRRQQDFREPRPRQQFNRHLTEQGGQNYCSVCERSFPSSEILELHEAEDHVFCDFERCTWSGPPQILAGHRLSHIRNEQGEKITESATEAALWVAARRRSRMLKLVKTEEERGMIMETAPRLSLLELSLRSDKGPGNRASIRRVPQSVLVPSLGNFVNLYENRRRDLTRTAPSVYKPGTKIQYHAQFPICHPLLFNRPCPSPDKCKRSHDVQAYRRWEFMKNKTGARIRNIVNARQTLLHMLLADEIEDFEDVMIAACKSLYMIAQTVNSAQTAKCAQNPANAEAALLG